MHDGTALEGESLPVGLSSAKGRACEECSIAVTT